MQYRDATMADRDHVLSIQVFDGLDYLTSTYDKHVTSSSGCAYVAEKDGKIVAFAFHTTFNDGDVIIERGERTKHEYRRLGIMTALKKHAISTTLSRYPNARLVGDSKLSMAFNPVQHPAGTTVKMEVPLCGTKPATPYATAKHFGVDVPMPDYDHLQLLNHAQIRQLLTSSESFTKIGKGQPVVISWVPFTRMSSADVQFLMECDNPTVIADLDARGRCSSVSFASCYETSLKVDPTDIHYRIVIDIYSSDRDLAIQHVYSQVHRHSVMLAMYNAKMHFLLALNCPATREDILDALAKIGIERFMSFRDDKIPSISVSIRPTTVVKSELNRGMMNVSK
ncbi:PREDICTED: histidine N-acetyltransferase-like [Priapulus caudatus]|uniref:Histidine N-acetyltransferase-like n=1 Tax=Priapulus caudatus TaxID=37621 RepID=A0ABM1EBZ0_PRICU|nr:PREDICTED: histidine N-acetyltransferase-like [Priapulus caudatus]